MAVAQTSSKFFGATKRNPRAGLHDNFLNLNRVYGEHKHIVAVNKAKKWIRKLGNELKQRVEQKKWELF